MGTSAPAYKSMLLLGNVPSLEGDVQVRLAVSPCSCKLGTLLVIYPALGDVKKKKKKGHLVKIRLIKKEFAETILWC